ncbi:MAG: DUF1003 domain-containing protein [Polaromonas sp.]
MAIEAIGSQRTAWMPAPPGTKPADAGVTPKASSPQSDPAQGFKGQVNAAIESFTEKNIETILCQEEERRKHKPAAYKAVQAIARFSGSLSFLWLQLAWFAIWIGYNISFKPFDPYPFQFLMLVVSLEAIFLSVLILISQNMSARESERRHHLDLQMNLLTERETTAMLRLMTRMAETLQVDPVHQEEVKRFAHKTDPAAVLKQIVKAEHEHKSS